MRIFYSLHGITYREKSLSHCSGVRDATTSLTDIVLALHCLVGSPLVFVGLYNCCTELMIPYNYCRMEISHNRTVPPLALAITLPSGLKVTAVTEDWCSAKVKIKACVSTSQSRTVLSKPALAIVLPSGLKATP